jgi:hypothetical protein
MQKRITHYLISVCYLKNNLVNFYNFILEKDVYPSRRSIEEYIGGSVTDSSNITVLGISPMNIDQYEQFND